MESTTGTIDVRPVVVRPQLRRVELTAVDTATSIRRGSAVASTTSPDLEELWDRYGASAYTLACALLGDEVAAGEAVRLAMADLARTGDSASTEGAWSSLARHVYRHAEALDARRSVSAQLPPVMVWVSRMARLQRASLALCVYGRFTHRDAAALLDVPPATVAELLTAGLRELRTLAAGHPRAEHRP